MSVTGEPRPAAPLFFTGAGVLSGMRCSVPLLAGLVPFGLVAGVAAQAKGLSLAEAALMSALVYAGSAQLLALSLWTSPAPVLAASFASLVINLRYALMGPVLTPWLERLRGWRLWGSLFLMVDQNWGLSIGEIRAGRSDAGFLFGSGLVMWVVWLASTVLGHLLGSVFRLRPGHPLFFAALAVFVALLVPLWRGRGDLLPWLVAGAAAVLTARLLPGTSWYIVVGALAGSLAGVVRDRRRPG